LTFDEMFVIHLVVTQENKAKAKNSETYKYIYIYICIYIYIYIYFIGISGCELGVRENPGPSHPTFSYPDQP